MVKGGEAAAKSAEGILARVARAIFKVYKSAGKKAPAGVRKVARGGGKHPFDIVPPGAKRRVLTPVKGKVRDGVEYRWKDGSGKNVRIRAHGRDPSAPPGTHASRGPVYRVEHDGHYIGSDGKRYKPTELNPDHPDYNPKAANNTHIPWPPHIPVPWEE